MDEATFRAMTPAQRRKHLQEYESRADVSVYITRDLPSEFRDMCDADEIASFQQCTWKSVIPISPQPMKRNWSGGATDHDHWSRKND